VCCSCRSSRLRRTFHDDHRAGDLEKNAIFAEAGNVKLGFVVMAIGIVIGDGAAAQPIPLPRPRPAELNAVEPPGELGLERATTPTACQLRLTPDRAVFRPLGEISGPGECGGSDIVSLERIVAKNRIRSQSRRPPRCAARQRRRS
jgi:hypothetical protein